MAKSYITVGIDASRAFVDDPAGPEYYSWHIIHELTKINYQKMPGGRRIHFILYLRPGQKPNFTLPQNFTLRYINMRYLWTQVGLALEAMRDRPNVLFIPAHTLPLVMRLLLPQAKIVVTIHGLEGKYLPQTGRFLSHIYRNWSIGWAVRFSDHLIAVSQDTMSDIIKTYHTNTKRITVIHEGVDGKIFKNRRFVKQKIYNLVEGTSTINMASEPYILFVGTLQPRKNLIRLIKAFSLLKNRRIKLVIAGKPGWLYEGILKAPGRYGVLQRVIFTGRVDEDLLARLYAGAKVFVLPSITEGFGLPILEAQASGVPVVSSYGGALREIAGEGAIFVNPKKVEDIAKALDEVLKSPKIRQELVQKGHKNVSKYSWELSAYNTLKLLLETASSK